jgi:hypothetical protein
MMARKLWTIDDARDAGWLCSDTNPRRRTGTPAPE